MLEEDKEGRSTREGATSLVLIISSTLMLILLTFVKNPYNATPLPLAHSEEFLPMMGWWMTDEVIHSVGSCYFL